MALAANCMQSSHKHRGRAGYIAKSRGIFEEVRIFWLAALRTRSIQVTPKLARNKILSDDNRLPILKQKNQCDFH
jgi:hypothetical protein